MSFLSAVLPGVREVRTPFAVGSLWLACIALGLFPEFGSLMEVRSIAIARDLLAAVPQTVALGVLSLLI